MKSGAGKIEAALPLFVIAINRPCVRPSGHCAVACGPVFMEKVDLTLETTNMQQVEPTGNADSEIQQATFELQTLQ